MASILSRPRRVGLLVVNDLRHHLKDGTILAFGLVVPILLIFVFDLVFSGADQATEDVTVAVSAPDDELAQVIPTVLDGIGDGRDAGGTSFIVQEFGADEASVEEATAAVENEDVDATVLVPADFGDRVRAGQEVDVDVIRNDLGLEGLLLDGVLQATLDQFRSGGEVAAAAQELGLDPERTGALIEEVTAGSTSPTWTQGETASTQLTPGSHLVAGQAGMFVLFTTGLSVLALHTERTQGTLARVLSTATSVAEVLAGKALAGLLLGIASTAVLLIFGRLRVDDAVFGPFWAVALLVVALSSAATAIMVMVARVARTAEQAGIAQSIVAIALGATGGAFFTISVSGPAAALIRLNPVRAFTEGLGISAGGGSLADLAPSLLSLAGVTVVALIIAVVMPARKELV